MKKAAKKPGGSESLSLDGMLSVNQSYSPIKESVGRKIGFEDSTALKDGFHAQRITSQLGRVSGEGSLSIDEKVAASESNLMTNLYPADKTNKPGFFTKFAFWKKPRREKKEKNLSRKQKFFRRLSMAAGVFLIIAVGYFGLKFWQTSHDVFSGGGSSAGLAMCRNVNQLNSEGDCRINILLLGVGGPGHDGPDLTDTILLASIDPVNNTTALLSIPRDLWVQIPGNGSQKINAAYAWGKQYSTSKDVVNQKRDGLKLLDQTLKSVIGMDINYHVVVDFQAFKEAVNELGGVSIDVPETLYDPTIAWENNNNPVIAQKGVQTMNGQQALLYARSRETSSDFARSDRQRALLLAISKKVLSLGTFSNPVKVSKLMNSFGNNVFTDLSVNDLSPLYSLASRIPSRDIVSLDLASSPGNLVNTGPVAGLSAVFPTAGIFDYSQIIPYVRATLRDGQLAKENATIAIYNATDSAGLATEKATVLKSYGYRVSTVASAPNPTNPTGTAVIDLSRGKNNFTLHYLEKRFKTIGASTIPAQLGIKPPAGTDFVIILGHDASVSNVSSTTTN